MSCTSQMLGAHFTFMTTTKKHPLKATLSFIWYRMSWFGTSNLTGLYNVNRVSGIHAWRAV